LLPPSLVELRRTRSSLSLLAMTSRYTTAFSRRLAPEFCQSLPLSENRGRRECRAPDSARSLVCEMKKAHKRSHHGHTGTPSIPRAMVLTVSFALSSVTGLSCHRRLAKLPPRDLTPASGRQDHTTSPSAGNALVSSAARVHRIPPPTSVTIAKRPSRGGGTESLYFCFYLGVKLNSEIPKIDRPAPGSHQRHLSFRAVGCACSNCFE
jgi:hypothetical protein